MRRYRLSPSALRIAAYVILGLFTAAAFVRIEQAIDRITETAEKAAVLAEEVEAQSHVVERVLCEAEQDSLRVLIDLIDYIASQPPRSDPQRQRDREAFVQFARSRLTLPPECVEVLRGQGTDVEDW